MLRHTFVTTMHDAAVGPRKRPHLRPPPARTNVAVKPWPSTDEDAEWVTHGVGKDVERLFVVL